MTVETASTPAAAARPAPLLVGAALTALEGAAMAGWGVYNLLSGFLGADADFGRAELGGAVLLLMGLLPVLAARALLRGQRWGRSPAVLTNSICLPVAYYMWQSGGVMAAVGVAVGLLGLAGIVGLLNPKVTAVLYGTPDDPR
ncbi:MULTISPECIES: hypothetical protein [Kitasatospora]|uniref:Integral membrane protein n=1 Tax=Kitasatospora setae (strain ATCC 33774 / DSM 43861 / JCM 3304 / KCC A-0304 / NBRC 14216 / KM-6054) TaxID=452652 RepID=E4NGU2_KITSK|nr:MULTISPECIES: hypothetical protein [Kitasatospora]BAJ30722.1 hypothetical protein KSE_49440 [Kitasatospora setae KM-6054]